MCEIPFLISTILLLYIYLGYPTLLAILAKAFSISHVVDASFEPTVTLIISAFNEEEIIGAKLENALSLHYPKKKLDIMVVSDCSTDRTDEIVRFYEDRGVRLLRQEERRGKTTGLNSAMASISSALVVFSDANALYDPYAIRHLVRHFKDSRVGYVVGRAVYEGAEDTSAGRSENAYWDLEIRMKAWESAFYSVVGGDGAIYAIRRSLYDPMEETDINDFVNPLQIISKGYRGLFEPEAVCIERLAGDFNREFKRKVRIVNRSFNGLLRVSEVCNPIRFGRFSWQIISHKLLRWFSPFLLAAQFLFALLIDTESLLGSAASVTMALYGFVAVAGVIGGLQDRKAKVYRRFFYFPYYFALVMMASAMGILLRLRGEVISIWTPAREGLRGSYHHNTLVESLLVLIAVLSFLRLLSFGMSLS